MDLKIFWTDFSKSELRKIFNYHKEVAKFEMPEGVGAEREKKWRQVENV